MVITHLLLVKMENDGKYVKKKQNKKKKHVKYILHKMKINNAQLFPETAVHVRLWLYRKQQHNRDIVANSMVL